MFILSALTFYFLLGTPLVWGKQVSYFKEDKECLCALILPFLLLDLKGELLGVNFRVLLSKDTVYLYMRSEQFMFPKLYQDNRMVCFETREVFAGGFTVLILSTFKEQKRMLALKGDSDFSG